MALVLHVLGDRAWWTVALLYGPRWALVLPGLAVIPWLVAQPRRAAAPAVLALAIALFGVLGWCVGLARAAPAGGVPFRVLELNANGGDPPIAGRIVAEIEAARPDVVAIPECNGPLARVLATLPDYHLRTGDYSCALSLGDFLEWSPRDQTEAFRYGGSGSVIRALVNTPAGVIRLGVVHPATPRSVLDTYYPLSQIPQRGPATLANMAMRDRESREALAWVLAGPDRPTIIAGDFNMPVESAIFRRYWGPFRNAFSRSGWGPGHTKETRLWGVRIDHVLVSGEIGTTASWVSHDVGSDHLPLIADLRLPVSPAVVAH